MLERLKPYGLSTIVTVHCKENLAVLVNGWKIFAQFKRMFSMMFANPSSKTEKCWMLYPMTHDLVTEDKSLKAGLESIAMNVESITKEAFLDEAALTRSFSSTTGAKEAAHG